MRKTTLSEPRHNECNSGVAPPSSSQSLTATTKAETEWETSPRPWKKIKRTYTSRTNGQSFRGLADHDTDRALQESKDAVIRLPFHLKAYGAVGHDENVIVKDSQQYHPLQSAPPEATHATPKNGQVINGSLGRNCAFSTRLSNRRLIEGICKALEALLRATTCEMTDDNRGCRSLFSICLRQIPSYISEEQRLIDDDNPESDTDVASEVYTDLEAFGSTPDGGWEPLREVVRAHGVSLIREAIQEGLIELTHSRHILSLCLGLAAYDEAERVIESMIAWAKLQPLAPKGNTGFCAKLSEPGNKWDTSNRLHTTVLADEATRVIDALRYYVSQTGRYGFMYRQMAVLIGGCILPIDWISSKVMIDCWNGVIRSITHQDDHSQSAALLLQIAISMSYRRGFSNVKTNPRVHNLRLRACESNNSGPSLRSYKSGQKAETAVQSKPLRSGEASARPDDKDSALQSTLSNILLVLSAISILRPCELGPDSSHHDLLSVAILQDIALEIRQALELATLTCYANRSWSVPTKELRLPLLSAGLVSVVSRKAGTAVSPCEVLDIATLASLPSSKESVHHAGSFLSEVARCCDSAGSGDGFHFVQAIVKDLVSIAVSDAYDKPTRTFCSVIANAAAFAFSEDTGQPKHLDWALDIEGTTTRSVDDSPKAVVDRTPARALAHNKSGYKWEEGICEWIAKTPAIALEQPTAVEDVDHDSTKRESPTVMLKQALPLVSAVSPCATDRRLYRPKRRKGGRGAGCDSPEIGNTKIACGSAITSERLLFIRVSPRPQKSPRPRSLSKVDATIEFDELSTLESSFEKPIALREVPNPPSGREKKSFGRRHHNETIGIFNLDMQPTKRRRFDRENCSQDTEDELGL